MSRWPYWNATADSPGWSAEISLSLANPARNKNRFDPISIERYPLSLSFDS
jgi:hypothetical protein